MLHSRSMRSSAGSSYQTDRVRGFAVVPLGAAQSAAFEGRASSRTRPSARLGSARLGSARLGASAGGQIARGLRRVCATCATLRNQ